MTARAPLFSPTTTGATTQEAAIEATGLQPSDDLEVGDCRDARPGRLHRYPQGYKQRHRATRWSKPTISMRHRRRNLPTSARAAQSGPDDAALIGGLIISSEASAQANIVVRALGPSLGAHGVAGALQDPTLELHDVNGNLIAFERQLA